MRVPLTSMLCTVMQTFIDLCEQPVAAYLDRFNFKSPLLKSMYAVTDGFSGLNGSWQTPGTGMNFLMHNMVRTYCHCSSLAWFSLVLARLPSHVNASSTQATYLADIVCVAH